MAGTLENPAADSRAPADLFFAADARHSAAGGEIPALSATGFCAGVFQSGVVLGLLRV
jgi:hypothetical protein